MSRPDTLTEKAQEAIFNDLLSRDENQQCADCDNKTPTWCSIDFGIFICMRCAGVHRQLGPHITRVRSTKLDSWKKENIEILAHVGNKIANEFYEAKMPNGFRKPNNHYSMAQVAKFVDEKYIKKLYAAQKSPTPVEEFVANRKEGIVRPPTLVKEQSETTHNHPKTTHKIERKRSLSMEPKQEEKAEPIDLLSAADDLLTSQTKGEDLFEEFQNAEPQQKETKKINFDGFKNKGQQQQGQEVQSSNLLGSNNQTVNPVFVFNINGGQQNQQTQQQNQQFQFQPNQQSQQQQTQQQQQNSNNTQQTDFMKLYSQTNTNTSNKGYGSNNVNWNELNLISGGNQVQNGGFNNGGMNQLGYSNYNQGSYGYGNYQNNSSSNFGGFNNGGYNYGNNNVNNVNNGGYNMGGYNNGYNNGFNTNGGGNFTGGYSNQGLGNFNGYGNNFGSQNVYNNNNFMKLN